MSAESLLHAPENNGKMSPFGIDLFVELDSSIDVSPAACVTGLYTPEGGVDPGSGNNDDWGQIVLDNFIDTSEPYSLN